MKRALILGLAALLVGAVTVAAQSPQKPTPQAQAQTQTGAKAGANFVDANGDGICDHYQDGTCPCGGRMGARQGATASADGTGNQTVCPMGGMGRGRGAGRGMCDGTGPKGPGFGRGPRR